MKSFDELLASSAKAHGHLCPGQVVGVRMAMLGCRLIDIADPHKEIKKLIVYVEMDRCTADSVAHVTGVRLGRRSLKHKDYGIMAATFLNVETGKAIRIISTEEARDLTAVYAPGVSPKSKQQLTAYKKMPDSVLFKVQEVDVRISEFDLPGPTRQKVACMQCGQIVRDHREVYQNNKVLCQICAGNTYFQNAREITWPDMNWRPADNENHQYIIGDNKVAQ